jgi:hypothetical protein
MTYKTPELHRMFAIPDMFSRFPQWNLWLETGGLMHLAAKNWLDLEGSVLHVIPSDGIPKFPKASSCLLRRHTNIEKVS